jgi:hypothetical protein
MTYKICCNCNKSLDFSCFAKASKRLDGLQTMCKSCQKEYRESNKCRLKQYFENRKDQDKESAKRRYLANKEERLTKNKEWRIKNIEKDREIKRKYRESNKEKIIEDKKRYEKRRTRDDLDYKIKKRIRYHVWRALRYSDCVGVFAKKELLGCTIDELKQHLESKFQPGMTWNNYGEWHIDHKIPISAIDKHNIELSVVCHYTNLEPLWARDNISKSDKML